MIPVRDIDIKNSDFLEILNEYKDLLLKREDGDETPLIAKEIPIGHEDENAEDWLNDEYMHGIINQGRGHEGFPRILKGFSGLKHENDDVRGAIIVL